jgi:NarL family two-component system response regulator YdfI
METPIRILIAGASQISREGLLRVFSGSSDFTVSGSTVGLLSLSSFLLQTQPDMVLIESDAPDEQLVGLVKKITNGPQPVPVVLLINDPSGYWSLRLFRSGGKGILSRDSRVPEILAGLRAVAAGFVVMQPESLDSMVAKVAPARYPLDYYEPLTRRELQVLQMIASGLGNKEIAAKLEISGHTVKFHINSIFTKLNVSSRTEAVTTGLRLGLILL